MLSVNKNMKSILRKFSIIAVATAMLWSSTALAQEISQGSPGYRLMDLEERIDKLEGTSPLRVSAGVETLYILADHNESDKDKGGKYFLDKFEVNMSGDFDSGLYYRSRWDYQVTQQAFFPAWTYAGYNHSDNWATEVGVIIQPLGAGVDGSYYDNSFLSDVPLWIGLANNSEPGIKTKFKQGNWQGVFAFTKNQELFGKPTARYRPDLIAVDDANGNPLSEVEVNNTFHGGGAYTIDLDGATLQLGSNGQYGNLYNTVTNSDGGQHWAATAFANYRSGGFAFTLQGMAYNYDLDRAPVGGPATTDTVWLSQGKPIPADGKVYSTRISYTMPASIGVFDTVQFYHDYDYLDSGSEDTISADDTQFSIAGVHLSRDAYHTWVSVYSSKNAAFANGGPDDDSWNTQLTVTLAVYF